MSECRILHSISCTKDDIQNQCPSHLISFSIFVARSVTEDARKLAHLTLIWYTQWTHRKSSEIWHQEG